MTYVHFIVCCKFSCFGSSTSFCYLLEIVSYGQRSVDFCHCLGFLYITAPFFVFSFSITFHLFLLISYFSATLICFVNVLSSEHACA